MSDLTGIDPELLADSRMRAVLVAAHYYARLIKANNRPLSAVLQPVARQLENIRADTTWFGGAY